MFGDIGFFEMAIIGALALIILGPERLPTAARTVGLFVGKARRMIVSAKADLKRELEQHDVYNEVNKVRQDVSEASRNVKDGLKEKDIGGIQSVKRDLENAVNDIKSDVQNTADTSSQEASTTDQNDHQPTQANHADKQQNDAINNTDNSTTQSDKTQ